MFPAIIEVPMGSKNIYELDKESGLLRLDRVLYSAVYYPAARLHSAPPLATRRSIDTLVLGQESVHRLTVVDAAPSA